MKKTEEQITHGLTLLITLISKLRTLKRLFILPQQLRQLPNKVEEEVVLLNRDDFFRDLDEKREALATLQSQSVRDILAEVTSFRRTFNFECFIRVIGEVDFMEDLVKALYMAKY